MLRLKRLQIRRDRGFGVRLRCADAKLQSSTGIVAQITIKASAYVVFTPVLVAVTRDECIRRLQCRCSIVMLEN